MEGSLLAALQLLLGGFSFEGFTDNQVIKHFFTNPTLHSREARWLELFAQFGIAKVNLKKRRVYMFDSFLSSATDFMQETSLLSCVSAFTLQ